jgi:tetratricopeptide (TPR) repeat protein
MKNPAARRYQSPLRAAWLLVLMTAVLPVLSAQSVFPSLEPDPRAPAYARRAAYGWQDLAEISLWASGGGENASFMERLREAAEEIGRTAPADVPERGEYILNYMHRSFLRSYSERQTRMDQLFTTGRYNCVSSAVLYMILAVSAGLDVSGVMTRDHAFVTVRSGTDLIDVETTNRYGFDPGHRKDFHDDFGRTTGFAYVPARNYRDRSAINRLELVSLILSNRISEAESRGRYAEAVSLALDRAALLSAGSTAAVESAAADSPFFGDPRGDLLNRLYNFGGALIRDGREEDALRWAVLAGEWYSGERWQEMIFAALNNLITRHIRAQRISEAREVLVRYAPLLDPENFVKIDTVVLEAELLGRCGGAASAEEVEAALEAVAASASRLPKSKIDDLRSLVIIKEGERRAAAESSPAAIAYIEEALNRYGPNPRLNAALRVFRENRVLELHNAFAGFYNRGNYEEACRIIQEGLKEFPGHRRLSSDLNLAERALRNE